MVELNIWHHAARFKGRSKVSTWLLGFIHHKVYDKLRKRGRHTWDDIDPAMPDENIDIERAIAGAQNAELIKRCMENLTNEHKEVIHLAFSRIYIIAVWQELWNAQKARSTLELIMQKTR